MKSFIFALVNNNNVDATIKTKNGLSVLIDYNTYFNILTLCHMEGWKTLYGDAGMIIFDAKIDSSKYSLDNIDEAIKNGNRGLMDMLYVGRRLWYLQEQDRGREIVKQKEYVDRINKVFGENKIDGGSLNVSTYKEPERANVAMYREDKEEN